MAPLPTSDRPKAHSPDRLQRGRSHSTHGRGERFLDCRRYHTGWTWRPWHATFCQGPYEESRRYRAFMGWEMPWYSALGSLETLLVGRRVGRMHLVCYLRQGSKVFETYWTTSRGVEYMDNSYRLLDLTVYGRQERFEDSPAGWPQPPKGTDTMRADGRPLAQWPRLKTGYSDDLGPSTR